MAAIATFERLLPLSGGFNLRDLGGYPTESGGHVRTGMLYRSGTMVLLTPDDEAHLKALGIATVCDLRRPDERSAEPTRWAADAGVHTISRDYSGSTGLLAEQLRHVGATPATIRASMIQVYRDLPFEHAPSYATMFARLIEGHVPLLFNCTAGKDRTGVAAALILHALGVARETIVEDYLATNRYADFSRLFHDKRGALYRILSREPDLVAPILTVAPDYLAATFETLDARQGGVDGYLEDVLGVDAAARAALRDLLVE